MKKIFAAATAASLAAVCLAGVAIATPASAASTAPAGDSIRVTQDVPNNLNTKVTIYNDTDNGVWVKIGSGTIDISSLISHEIEPGSSYSVEGYSSFQHADVWGDIDMNDGTGKIHIEAGNPIIGTPWITIGGQGGDLDEGTGRLITEGNHQFYVQRNNDLPGAKDFVVHIIK